MALKDFLPKDESDKIQTSVQVNAETYSKVKAKLKKDGISFHDLVNAAMLDYLQESKKRGSDEK